MRNSKGQFVKGATGNPMGRPKRADEQFLIDLWEEHGQKAFSNAVEKKEQWALKLLMDKLYSNKRDVEARVNADIFTLGTEFGDVFKESKKKGNVAISELLGELKASKESVEI